MSYGEEQERVEMSYGEEQRREIKTIRERIIKLNLSDADCRRAARKAGSAGMTIGELLEHFKGDLVDGTFSSGNDERMYAENWFERCGYERNNRLLGYLMESGGAAAIENFWFICGEKEHFEEHPEEYEDNVWFLEDYNCILTGFINQCEEKPDMEQEMNQVWRWGAEQNALEYEVELV